MFVGKLVAGLLGFFVVGVPGLIFGLVLGHLFDRALAGVLGMGTEDLEALRKRFFDTVFQLMGYVAKADGRVSEDEVAHTEQVFAQLGLQDTQRQEAIRLFRLGTADDFNVESALQAFLHTGGAHPALKQTLMIFLLALALADHEMDPAEQTALRHIGKLLGYGAEAVEELLRMAIAQDQFHDEGIGTANNQSPTLADAYAALGVEDSASDAEVKRAYRRLMSQNHPDKLSARGVPEDMLKIATQKSQEIQAAYEMVKKTRAGQ
jgi:DnaJ like chaperone protein